MEALVWIGTAVSLLGVAGLILCIVTVARARRSGMDDAALRGRLQKVVVWNFAALLVSALGLMLVVVGIMLG